MPAATTHFTEEAAPCGRTVAGDHFRDQDDQCVVSDEWFYDCGCKTIRHEYHDGATSRQVIRHDGRVLVNELMAER